jgi:hypothetical protein
MIKRLPTQIKLPNSIYTVQFKSLDAPQTNFGDFSLIDYSIILPKCTTIYSKYQYFLFISHCIASTYCLTVTPPILSTISFIMYSLCEKNNILKLFNQCKSTSKLSAVIEVYPFHLNVRYGKDDEFDENGLGTFSPKIQEILIRASVPWDVKCVVLLHEFFEWVNSIFYIKMRHSDIQTFAEGWTFVLRMNSFTT